MKMFGMARAGAIVLVIGCHPVDSHSEPGRASAATSSREAPSALPQTAASSGGAVPEAITLLERATSAYQTVIAADRDAAYLLTEKVAYRLVPGNRVQQVPIDHGIQATLAGDFLVYWSAGAVFRVPKRGGEPRRLAAVPREPQYFVSSGEEFAWLLRTGEDKFEIQVLSGKTTRTVLAPAGRIEALAMSPQRLFFVERVTRVAWRLGTIPLRGGDPTYAPARGGRTPSMLIAPDDLYYYEGNTREVRRVSATRLTERTLRQDFICSPIAAREQVYCANMDGIFELALEPGAPPVAVQARGRDVAGITASSSLVAWVRDTAAERLAVEMVPLPLPQTP